MLSLTHIVNRIPAIMVAGLAASCAQTVPQEPGQSPPVVSTGSAKIEQPAFVEVTQVGKQPASEQTRSRRSLCLAADSPERISPMLPWLYGATPEHWIGAGRYKATKILQYKLSKETSSSTMDYAVMYFTLSDPWTADAPKEVRATFAHCSVEKCNVAVTAGQEYVLLLVPGHPTAYTGFTLPFTDSGVSFGGDQMIFRYVPEQSGWTNGEIGAIQAVAYNVLREAVVTGLAQMAKSGACTVDLAPQSPTPALDKPLDDPSKSGTIDVIQVESLPGGTPDAGSN